MTAPPLPADFPPHIAKMIATMQRQFQTQLKLAFGLIGTLATGLVGLTVYCLQHG